MKKCPFCKAEIQENARFCLYCMKPLVEKEVISPRKKHFKPWGLFFLVLGSLLIIGALVALCCACVLIYFFVCSACAGGATRSGRTSFLLSRYAIGIVVAALAARCCCGSVALFGVWANLY